MRARLSKCSVLAVAGVLAIGLLAGCSASREVTKPGTLSTKAAAVESDSSDNVAASDDGALLTPADVERVSGLTGLKALPYQPDSGSSGKVNIAESDGMLIVRISVWSLEEGVHWDPQLRQISSDDLGGGRAYGPTIGEESLVAPEGSRPTMIVFKQGDSIVAVETFFRENGQLKLESIDQLDELARIVSSRL